MKIRPMGAELFHAGGRADGRTDMRTYGRRDTSNSRFSQFCDTPTNRTGG